MRVKSSGNYRREEIPPTPSAPVELNFKNHCLFCLEPQHPNTVLEIIRDNPKNLKSFQPVLHYLTGTDPTYDKSIGECEWMGIPAMENLPPMCYPCYGAMAELYRLHEQLLSIQCLIQEQTQVARQTVPLRSQSFSRHQFMTRIQSSGLNKVEVAAARKFVDVLHNKIIEEVSDKKKVIFPSRTPPHFSPNAVTCLPSANSSATDYHPECTATSSTASSQIVYPRSSSRGQLVSSPCLVLENTELVMLPPVVETDDIKYENEYGDDDEKEEMKEPYMIIPDFDVTSQDPIAESRTMVSPMIKNKGTPSFDPSRSLSPLRPRRSRSSIARKLNRDAKDSGLEQTPRRRRRLRNVRKMINGVSTYIAQYCDLCNKYSLSTKMLKHLENDHNLKGYVVACPSPKCPYLFSCRGKMEKHLRTQNPSRCQVAAMLPDGSLTKTCETCGFEAESRATFRNHLQGHESKLPEKTFSCPISGCPKGYALRQSVEYHIDFHDLRPSKMEKQSALSIQKKGLHTKAKNKHENTDNIQYGYEEEEELREPHMMEEEELQEPHMIIPDIDIAWEPPSPSGRDTHSSSGSSAEESRTRVSTKMRKKVKKRFKKSSSLQTLRPRTSRVRTDSKSDDEDNNSDLDGTPKRRRRRRLVRKWINGVSVYVAQYCDLCNKYLLSAEVLKHLEDDHNLKGYVVDCPNPKCPYMFSCSAKMEKHLRNQNPHKCQMAAKRPAGALSKTCEACGFETKSRTRLRNHLYRHELNLPEKTFSCPISGCAEKCALKQSIDDHINFHELGPPKTEQECSVCKELLQIEDVTEHLREAHQMENPVACKRCPFIFHDWESLLEHLNEHYAPGGMSCDICENGVRIAKLEFLREHYFSVHGVGKELICEGCDKPFYLLSVLSIHKNRCASITKKDQILDTDNIKYENKHGDEDEQELQDPEANVPDEYRTRISPKMKDNAKGSFEPRRPRPLQSLNRLRKLVSVAVNKTRVSRVSKKLKKNAEGVVEVERVPRRRLRNVRKVINGVSVYVAQYCDLCNKYLPSTKMLKHLENEHNLKGYVVGCPSPKCPYLFSCRGKMEKHVRTQNPKKCQMNAKLPMGSLIKKCETCEFETGSSATLREHLHKHELAMPEKTVSCPISGCIVRCALKQSIDDHINFHELRPPRTEQECSVCKELLKVEDISEHLNVSHKIEQPVPCKRCCCVFHDWEALLKHLNEHDSPGGLSCDLCDNGGRIEKFEPLLGHYFSIHKIGQQLICEFCSKPFYMQTMLAAHIKRAHSKDKKERKKKDNRIKCELCPEPIFFKCRMAQRMHDIRFHEGDPFNCKFCDKTFMTKHGLNRHEIEHTGKPKYAYKCNVEGCGRAFQNRTLLGYHELGQHTGTGAYQCDTCGKKFNYGTALKHHVDRVHLKTTEKCICQTCGKTLATKNSLRTHMLVHTGARPHVCHICNQAFRHREAMLTHVRAHEEKGERFRPKGPRSS